MAKTCRWIRRVAVALMALFTFWRISCDRSVVTVRVVEYAGQPECKPYYMELIDHWSYEDECWSPHGAWRCSSSGECVSPDGRIRITVKEARNHYYTVYLYGEAYNGGRLESVMTLREGEPGSGPDFALGWSTDSRTLYIYGRTAGLYGYGRKYDLPLIYLVEKRVAYVLPQKYLPWNLPLNERPDGVYFKVGKNKADESVVHIIENGDSAARFPYPDIERFEAELAAEHPLDFDADGIDELTLRVWHGGNGGDWLYVFGKRGHAWSEWGRFFLLHFQDPIFRDENGDGRLDVVVATADDGKKRVVHYYTEEGFAKE